MENLSLTADKRTQTGKSAARLVRRAGKIPGVVYGLKESTPLVIDPKELETLLSTSAGVNVVFDLRVAGEKGGERPVIVKEMQRDPMRGVLLHADLLEIRMDRKIQVSVPLVLVGESPGEKLGGTLSQMLRELDVACLPNAIPEQVEVDVSEMEIGDVFHVRELGLPEGVDLVADPDEPVLTVMAPVEEEEEEPEEELEGVDAEEGEADGEADGEPDSPAET